MNKSKVECNWTNNMSFEVDVNDHIITIDAEERVGGENRGPRPKALLLAGLAGCTGMDVVSILKKMRVEPDDFNITAEAEQSEEHPVVYTKIHLTYTFKGNNLPFDKIDKAVNLSQDRYCGVSAMLSKTAELTHEIVIVG